MVTKIIKKPGIWPYIMWGGRRYSETQNKFKSRKAAEKFTARERRIYGVKQRIIKDGKHYKVFMHFSKQWRQRSKA